MGGLLDVVLDVAVPDPRERLLERVPDRVGIDLGAVARPVRPEAGRLYILVFGSDGTFSGQLDCNRATGT